MPLDVSTSTSEGNRGRQVQQKITVWGQQVPATRADPTIEHEATTQASRAEMTEPVRDGEQNAPLPSSKSKPCQGGSLAGFLVLLASETLVV
jgi:hypothetical protein